MHIATVCAIKWGEVSSLRVLGRIQIYEECNCSHYRSKKEIETDPSTNNVKTISDFSSFENKRER